LVTQYQFEDDSDTNTAIDAVGNNDATVTGAAFNTSDVRCGSVALDTDGSDDNVRSNSTVDLVNDGGVGAAVGGFFKPDDDNGIVAGYGAGDGDNYLEVEINRGNWTVRSQTSEGTFNRAVGPAVDTSAYQHVIGTYDGSDIILLVDTAEEARTGSSDLTNIGAGDLVVGQRPNGIKECASLHDNVSFANTEVTINDQQELIQQC
jgi:hypothetical protein